MRRRICLLILFIFTFAVVLSAHPLGNFTINQYSKIEIEKSQIKVYQVLDLAEIPTFQLFGGIDFNNTDPVTNEKLNRYLANTTPIYLNNIFVTVNGEPVNLEVLNKNISLNEGAGNLSTLRVEWTFEGNTDNLLSINAVHFENKNYTERIGWNEIVVIGDSGFKIFNSTAFGDSLSSELRAYPTENLSAPLNERSAAFSYTSETIPADAKIQRNRDGQPAKPIEKDKFAELINVPQITLPIALFGLLVALGLGSLHALSPGHGKTIVGAYLVGSRGTIKHAVFLGVTVTITHTLGVFALGLITLFASKYILPERMMPVLNLISGLFVVFIGLTLFKERLFAYLGWQDKVPEKDLHNHEDTQFYCVPDGNSVETHTHGGSTHTHLPPQKVTWRNLLILGISGGLLPCPSALVLMLSAISLNRIAYGLVLTLVFSMGLALTLTSIGLIFLYVGKIFNSPTLSKNPIIKMLPIFSALIVTGLGAIVCYTALM